MFLGECCGGLRIVGFLRIFTSAEFILYVHARPHMIGSNHRFKCVHQRLRQLFVETKSPASSAIAIMQQGSVAVGVDDGDVLRTEAVDRTRYQLWNGLLGFGRQMSASRFKNDSGFGVMLLFGEQ